VHSLKCVSIPNHGQTSLSICYAYCSVKLTQNVYINAASSSTVTHTAQKISRWGPPALLVTPLTRHSPEPTSANPDSKHLPVFKLAQQHAAHNWASPQDTGRLTLKVCSFLPGEAHANLGAMHIAYTAWCSWLERVSL
jgi:hypothetical protein